MIPKIIHYCWLSDNTYPEKIQYCIDSWKKVLPEYEFILWDLNRFDINSCVWVKQAFESCKYAFAADYIRLYAVYNYGGIYLDSDVEVIKPFDDLLNFPYFVGKEAIENRIELAAFGAEKNSVWVKSCLDYYQDKEFVISSGKYETKVLPDIVYEVLSKYYNIKSINSINDFVMDNHTVCIFPNDWFCAHVYSTFDSFVLGDNSVYKINENTYCVHHFANSWIKVNKTKLYIKKLWLKIRPILIKKD
jgi:mannosyltransferase OCH1-like enzyme